MDERKGKKKKSGEGWQTFRNGIKWKGSRGEGARGEHAVSLCVTLPLAQSKPMHADVHRAKTRCSEQQHRHFQWCINIKKQGMKRTSYNEPVQTCVDGDVNVKLK